MAVLAGVAGMLSLTTNKSQAIIGVFVSVTTIPAAAAAGVAMAYGEWSDFVDSAAVLALNLGLIALAGVDIGARKERLSPPP